MAKIASSILAEPTINIKQRGFRGTEIQIVTFTRFIASKRGGKSGYFTHIYIKKVLNVLLQAYW
jgi:hypothetical protein